MKSIVVMAMLAFGSVASAETIDLHTHGGFGALHQYHGVETSLCTAVPCEVEHTVTMYLPQSTSNCTQNLQLWFGDLTPDGQFFGPYCGSGVPTVLTNLVTGQQMALAIDETSIHRVVNSGRAHYWVTNWTLQSGTISWQLGALPEPGFGLSLRLGTLCGRSMDGFSSRRGAISLEWRVRGSAPGCPA